MPSKVTKNPKTRLRKKKENNDEEHGLVNSPTKSKENNNPNEMKNFKMFESKSKSTSSIQQLQQEHQQIHQTQSESESTTSGSSTDTFNHIKTESKSRKPQQSSTSTQQHKKSNKTHHTALKMLNNSLNNSIKSNKKITDYFQIRKSSRKCKSDIEKEKRHMIETAIKSQKEEGLEVKTIPNKGRGIFATKHFQRGDFVCEYAGEMISYKAAKKREEIYAMDASVGCYMYFFEHKSKGYCIDATAETSRLGRLLNHSKLGGNCHTKLFEMNSRPYLILLASRDIRPGEEMTYDYGDRNKISLESHPWLAE